MAARIDMVGLFANDVPAMVRFYCDVLGFEVEGDDHESHAEFRHEGVRFSMYKRAMLPDLLGEEATFPRGLNGTFELALDLPRFEDVDVFFEKAVEAGAKAVTEPRDEPWGMRSSYVADPEGNLIEIGSWNKGAKG